VGWFLYRTAIKGTNQYLNDIKGLSTCALVELANGISKSYRKKIFHILNKSYIHTHTHRLTHICVYICIYICMYICIYICMYICIYLCVCGFVCIHVSTSNWEDWLYSFHYYF